MKFLEFIDRMTVVVSVTALLTMMLMISVSVVGRYFFSMPIPDDLVFSEFLMVFVVFLPLSAVQAAREHVFVTIFSDWMSNKSKVIMETFGVFVGLIAFGIVTAAVWTDAYAAWQVGAYVEGPLELPEWPARFVVFFGLALFTVRLLVDLVMSIIGIRDGTALATKSEEDRILEAEL